MATLHLTQYRVDTLKPRKVILDVRDTELKGSGAFGRQTLTGESGRPSTMPAAVYIRAARKELKSGSGPVGLDRCAGQTPQGTSCLATGA